MTRARLLARLSRRRDSTQDPDWHRLVFGVSATAQFAASRVAPRSCAGALVGRGCVGGMTRSEECQMAFLHLLLCRGGGSRRDDLRGSSRRLQRNLLREPRGRGPYRSPGRPPEPAEWGGWPGALHPPFLICRRGRPAADRMDKRGRGWVKVAEKAIMASELGPWLTSVPCSATLFRSARTRRYSGQSIRAAPTHLAEHELVAGKTLVEAGPSWRSDRHDRRPATSRWNGA